MTRTMGDLEKMRSRAPERDFFELRRKNSKNFRLSLIESL